jgi:hypothetical protein
MNLVGQVKDQQGNGNAKNRNGKVVSPWSNRPKVLESWVVLRYLLSSVLIIDRLFYFIKCHLKKLEPVATTSIVFSFFIPLSLFI